MSSIDKLTELFRGFPGIGPRQAKRFVYFLLTQGNGYADELSKHIADLKSEIQCCVDCRRFFPKDSSNSLLCSVCRNASRDKSQLMIVSRDVDFENIERTKSFGGYYFILGGTIPVLSERPKDTIREKELLKLISKKVTNHELKEVILALDVNPEGEHTESYIKRLLGPFSIQHGFNVSTLGRGLSMGSELEYSDPDTIKSALQSRK